MPQFTVDDIKEAIKNQDIYLVYQPIVSLTTFKIVAYEALARWQFKGEFISPGIFMGFGDSETMRSLTQYVLNIAEEMEKRLNIPIHVNITVYDLFIPITNKISCLELTEETSRQSAINRINKLSEKYQIVIDDFGQNYAGWIDLPYINISKIKIDKRVVDELLLDKSWYYELAIKAIVCIGHKMGVKIVAEGIEAKEQVHLLKSFKVDQGQGYYFGKPAKINELKIN